MLVIAPDIVSGSSFYNQLLGAVNQYKIKQPHIDFKHFQIAPRVIQDTITPNTNAVSLGLESALNFAINNNYRFITIACNTLSLPVFLKPVLTRTSSNIKILTTINCIEKLKTEAVFLGTKVACDYLHKSEIHIKTIYCLSHISISAKKLILQLTQHIIWEAKYLDNADVSTAGSLLPPNSTRQSIIQSVIQHLNELKKLLEKHDITELILGCTELPPIINAFGQFSKFKLIDPATLVGREYALLVGTANDIGN